MKVLGFRLELSFAIGAVFFLLPQASSYAQSGAQMFSDKQINLYIGFGYGGSYDYYGRLVARHLGRHLPGRPTIVAQNMPGAGGIQLANFMYSVAPKDGTALATTTQSVATEGAIGKTGVSYKAEEFNWIGRVTDVVDVVITWQDSRVKTIEDAKIYEFPFASTGPGSPTDSYPRLLNGLIGTKFKIIGGYAGGAAVTLAFERREVDSVLKSWSELSVSKPDWIEQKQINILFQGSSKRAPYLANVPTIAELGITPLDKQVLEFNVSGAVVGRSLMAPPGVPSDRVKALRTAFSDMVSDSAFLAEIQKAKVPLAPLSGENLQQLIAQSVNVSKEVIEVTKKLTGIKK